MDTLTPDEMRRIVDALYLVHHLYGEIANRDTLLAMIIEQSKTVANAEGGSLLLYDEGSDELYFHVALGDTGDMHALKREIRLGMGQGIAGEAASSRRTICVNNAEQDPRVYREADDVSRTMTRSLLAAPLLHGDRLVGVLEVLNKEGDGSFTDSDCKVLEIFSSLAASVILRAQLIEENLQAERLAAVGRTVAGLSHYTKNLLAGVSMGMESFDEGLAGEDLDLLRAGWPIMRRNVDRIGHVVEDMLAFSKDRTPLYDDADVAEICRDAVTDYRGVSTEDHVPVEVSLEGAPSSWRLDARGIGRCILNLLVNAADVLQTSDGIIRLEVSREAEELVLALHDNGPGVPDDLRYRIFDPFFSSKGSRGTGLGLAVTRKIVNEHGGNIRVSRSELGGACFTIRIPSSPRSAR